MGLIYSSSDSSAMMRALSSNLAVARTTTSELTAGCQQLIAAIDGHTLSGAAYNAGKGLFSELVIPTIHRMTAAVDNVQSDLAKYSAADAFIASEGFLDEDKLKLKIKIMKANQQLLHDSARAVATLAHSQPIPGIYELLQNAQRTFIKMADSMQQDIDKLHKQIQKLNEFDRQTKNLFATSLEEMQLAMQGILVLNETTVKSNGLYTLPSGVDKSYFTEIKKEASTVLETAKPKIELIKKTDSLEEISRKTIACANIGINPYTGKKISQKEANKFKYAAWAGTLTEVGNVVLGSYYGNKTASRLKNSGQGKKSVSSKYDMRKYTYNGFSNPGPLSEMYGYPIKNFYGGRYNQRVLTQDAYFYRAGEAGGLTIPGKGKNALGQWFTYEAPESVAKVRIDTAVKPQWINPKTGFLEGQSIVNATYKIKVPKGTTIYEGPVGLQNGLYAGGLDHTQIFISEPWKLKGIEIISESKLK
ncbi:TPA: hypothetical protein ITS68_001252 [Enterococcus faecalis]|nr:hypothetical protein [Enterococcus faecalis]HAP3007158.1 hypothetical protein [Enterococcus faecalis]